MRTSSCSRTKTDPTRAGLTLLELIVVVTILSTLFGVGLGAWQRLARPDRQATTRLKEALREARLHARSEGAPATVVVRPAAGEVYALGLRRVGNWHFEDPLGTGWPVVADHPPQALVQAGVLGGGLRLDRDGWLRVEDLPASSEGPWGFGVEVHLRPDPGVRPMTVLERPGRWALALDREDALVVLVVLEAEQGGPSDEATEELRRVVPGPPLPADRWSRLAVLFDGRALTVTVDGRRRLAETLLTAPRRLARPPGAVLRTGTEPDRYRGDLDELILSAVVRGDVAPLPPEVRVEGEERLIHLDARGHLDPLWHRTPERVSFLHDDPPRRSVVELGLLGDVRSYAEAVVPEAER